MTKTGRGRERERESEEVRDRGITKVKERRERVCKGKTFHLKK